MTSIRLCPVCGAPMPSPHDHKPDHSGIDDGPLISAPRKKSAPKTPESLRLIRKLAWKTRREKYGQCGHR